MEKVRRWQAGRRFTRTEEDLAKTEAAYLALVSLIVGSESLTARVGPPRQPARRAYRTLTEAAAGLDEEAQKQLFADTLGAELARLWARDAHYVVGVPGQLTYTGFYLKSLQGELDKVKDLSLAQLRANYALIALYHPGQGADYAEAEASEARPQLLADVLGVGGPGKEWMLDYVRAIPKPTTALGGKGMLREDDCTDGLGQQQYCHVLFRFKIPMAAALRVRVPAKRAQAVQAATGMYGDVAGLVAQFGGDSDLMAFFKALRANSNPGCYPTDNTKNRHFGSGPLPPEAPDTCADAASEALAAEGIEVESLGMPDGNRNGALDSDYSENFGNHHRNRVGY